MHMKHAFLFALFAVLVLAGASFAGCSGDSYSKACSQCPFDASGKMDPDCWQQKQDEGTTCLASKYPLASAQYSQGKCPQIDDCIAELKSCSAQYATGNDKADCDEGSVGVCYAVADACTQKAAGECGEIEGCPVPSAFILAVLLGACFLGSRA